MSIILSHSKVLLGQNHRNLNCVSAYFWILYSKNVPRHTIQISMVLASLLDSMMLILAAREILYTGPLISPYIYIHHVCSFLGSVKV